MVTEQEYKNFKSLLEYFVAHLEYVANNKDESCRGYDTYIKPLVDSGNFKNSGNGYKGHRIQVQVAAWEQYAVGKIAINCQPSFGGNFRTRQCYLNWIPTGLNVNAQWENEHVSSLSLEAYQDENSWVTVTKPISLDNLGLYIDDSSNDTLKKFFDDFCKMKEQYNNDQKRKAMNQLLEVPYLMLQKSYSVILTGAPGTGKTFAAIQMANELTSQGGNWEKVQFHPSYDYSDFIIGLKPEITNNGDVTFEWKNGIFKTFAQSALAERKLAEEENRTAKPYVFIIDEINRADLSRVYGEVFSLLEEEYRYPNKKKGITLPGKEKNETDNDFILPDNLYIIGTMNDIDRSVESMDFALRRRFSWYEVKAEDSERIIDAEKDGVFKITDEEHREVLKRAMTELNKYIGGEEKEGEELKINGQKVSLNLGDEYKLGGAYFLNFAKYQDKVDAWDKLWNNHIAIILNEYLRGHKLRSDIIIALREKYDACVR